MNKYLRPGFIRQIISLVLIFSLITNGALVATLNRGQFHERIINGPAQIEATAPVMVMQYSNSSTFDGVADPFMMLIPPFEHNDVTARCIDFAFLWLTAALRAFQGL